MPACFDTIGKGMDTVPTRFDALQVYNSRYLNILTLKISGSFIGANTSPGPEGILNHVDPSVSVSNLYFNFRK